MKRATAALLLAACSSSPAPPPPAVTASVLTGPSPVRGPQARGQVGDYYLASDVLEAIVAAPAHLMDISPTGGVLIDLALKGRPNDQLNEVAQIFALSQSNALGYDACAIGDASGATASVVCTGKYVPLDPAHVGKFDGLKVATEYRLNAGEPFIRLKTTLTNTGAALIAPGVAGDIVTDVFHWGPRGEKPFAPFLGRGFAAPPVDVQNPVGALGQFDFVVGQGNAVGDGAAASYAIFSLTESGQLVTGVNDPQFSAIGQYLNAGALAPGESARYERRIAVGGRNDVASSADLALLALGVKGGARGKVTGLDAADVLRTSVLLVMPGAHGETPYSSVQPEADGSWSARLKAGDYLARLFTPGAPAVDSAKFTVSATDFATAPDLAAPGKRPVTFTLKDAAGKPLAGKVTFKGTGATPNPDFGDVATEIVSANVAYTPDGAGSVRLAPGTYDAYASHGFTFTLAHQAVDLTSAAGADLAFTLQPAIDTTGLVSADCHVHAAPSFDSRLPLDARVVTFLGEGVDVLVATDHDAITDYGPTIQALGAQSRIVSVVGVEATSTIPWTGAWHTIGHENAFPLKAGSAMPVNELITLGDLWDNLRAIGAMPDPILQLNHPRSQGVGLIGYGFLTNVGFDTTKPVPGTDDGTPNGKLRQRSAAGTEAMAWDAQELINGTGYLDYLDNRADWFALLDQGFVKTGTANSDSHQAVLAEAGFPRNFVALPSALLADFDDAVFAKALRAGHSVGSSGPLVSASIGAAGPGDLAKLTPGAGADVHVRVQAAPWIPVDEIRIVVNGVAVKTLTPTAAPADPFGTAGALRYDDVVHLDVAADAWLVVEAGAKLPANGVVPAPPKYLDVVAPGTVPYGFTNAIRLDADGDGAWTPPGLPK